MPKKNLPPQVYKTEDQLKEEARIKQSAEAEASAAVHKTEFEKKAENFWYHYKWLAIVGVFIAFLLVFFIRDMFFRTRPDTIVLVISTSYIDDAAVSHMTSVLENFAADYNGDKKIMVSADAMMLPVSAIGSIQDEELTPDFSGGQQEMATMMKLMAVLAAGTEMIYLLDEPAHNYIVERNQTDESDSDGYKLFDDFSVPAEKLGPETSDAFAGMRFYLRTSYSDQNDYEFCKQILQGLDANPS